MHQSADVRTRANACELRGDIVVTMRAVRPVVVGVDGSAASFAAVRWAAVTAARRHAPLHLVHAIGVPADAVPVLGRLLFDTSGLRKVGDSALSAGRSIVQEAAGPVGVTAVETFVESSSPVPTLVGRSAAAQLLVVGARGLGAFERVMLGSVGIGLIRHARCPVAVVPDVEESVPRAPHCPVVVGVDGSRCSELASSGIRITWREPCRHSEPLRTMSPRRPGRADPLASCLSRRSTPASRRG